MGSARSQSERAQQQLEEERQISLDLRKQVDGMEGELASLRQQLSSIRSEASSRAAADAKSRISELESLVAKSEAQCRAAQRDRDSYRLQHLEARQAKEVAQAELEGLKAANEDLRRSKAEQIANLEEQIVVKVVAERRVTEKLSSSCEQLDTVRCQMADAERELERERATWSRDREEYQQQLRDERRQQQQIASELQQTKLQLLDTKQQLEDSQEASKQRKSRDASASKQPVPEPAPKARDKATFVSAQETADSQPKSPEAEAAEPSEADATEVTDKSTSRAEAKEPKVKDAASASFATSPGSKRLDPADFNLRAEERARLRAELADLKRDLEEAGFSRDEVKA